MAGNRYSLSFLNRRCYGIESIFSLLTPPDPIRVYRMNPITGSWFEEYITDPDEIEAFKNKNN